MRLPGRCLAALAIVTACADQPDAPTTAAILERARSALVVTTTLPIYQARAAADSSGTLLSLGEVTLSGRSGDYVTLKMLNDPVVGRALASTDFIVDEGGQAVRVSAASAVAGGVVYTFAEAGVVTLRIRMTRSADAATVDSMAMHALRGRFELAVEGSARVVSRKTPWATAATGRPALAHGALLDGGSCQVGSAGATCGDVSFDIAPFVGDGGFFQSDAGTGVSHAININFTGPVTFVAIQIGDPTYAGNTATAFDANGNEVSSVGFGFSGVPGVNEPDTEILTGTADAPIARILLIPADADYVYYSMAINMSPPTCGSVVRGEVLNCTAPGFSTASKWSFEPADGGDKIEEARTETTWSGQMGIGGTVSVTGIVQGSEQTVSTKVTVTPRPDWAGKTIPLNVTPVAPSAMRDTTGLDTSQVNLRVEPTGFTGQLGGSTHHVDFLPGWFTSTVTKIAGGPNAGISFLNDLPLEIKSEVAVNTDAVAKDSKWGKLQDANPPAGFCARGDIPELLRDIGKHEGLNGEKNSHTRIYHDVAEKIIVSGSEAIAGHDVVGPVLALKSKAHLEASNASGAMDNDAGKNILNGTKFAHCQFNYFPKVKPPGTGETP